MKSGTTLWDAAHRHGFTLCNIPLISTRLGSSVTRNTTPDLTFVRNVSQYTWQSVPHTFGSDHSIVDLTISGITNTQLGVARLTDWKAFRDTLEATPPVNSDLV
ncbi:hypothetical protein HPB48_022617 [Haemaphysalis longicornis]|uniref:Uncharacterized protein n=1 Tax=Haemaphysalis longicornis TaxID=44386 RepID=A0A9J6FYY2_HAELO|nr:hypothetical protein HPB48_022617 [Haemaphysalis longicornis]